jgi:hypothetical protein
MSAILPQSGPVRFARHPGGTNRTGSPVSRLMGLLLERKGMYGHRDHDPRGDSPIDFLNQSPLGLVSKLHSNSRARFGVRPVRVSGILGKRHTG